MDRFEAMRTLLAAVDGGSLSAASRTLDLPLATVSRRVSDLEAQLGAQLVVRTSRKLLLTEVGAAYVASARRVLEELSEAERMASGEYRAPRGELLVTAPIMFGKLHVAPVLHEFLGAFPDVAVRLVLSDEVIDLVEEHIDVAVRIGRLPDSALVARRLGQVRWLTCASPAYLERRGVPTTPADLQTHDCIAFEGLQRNREWTFARQGRAEAFVIHPRFSVNTADAVLAAAAAGLGIARLMSYQMKDSVGDGLLVRVLSDWSPAVEPVHVIYASRQPQPLKLRAFLDFAALRLQERLREIEDLLETTDSSVSDS